MRGFKSLLSDLLNPGLVKRANKSLALQAGFTLIEVLVAAVIIGLISGSGITAYRRLNERATVDGTAKLVEQSLRDAQKRATAGVKPPGCLGALEGYTIAMNGNTYQIQANCSDSSPPAEAYTLTDGTKFPVNKTIRFRVLGRGAELEGGASEDTIYVSNTDGTMVYGIQITEGGAVSGLGSSAITIAPTPTSAVTLTPTPTPTPIVLPPSPTPTATTAPLPTPTPTISGIHWWNEAYSYRMKIFIYAGSDQVPSSFTQYVNFSHSSMVNAGKALSSGNDVRVVYWTGSSWQELDRILDPTFGNNEWNSSDTRILFRLLADVSPHEIDDSYYLYYGNSSAGSPPNSEAAVWRYYNSLNSTSGLVRFGSCRTGLSISGGRLGFASRFSGACGAYDNNAPTLSDVEVLADVELYQTNSGRGGVIFREQGNGSGYAARIYPASDQLGIGAVNSSAVWTNGLNEYQNSSYATNYRFRVRVVGSSIRWWFRTLTGNYQGAGQNCTAGSGSCSSLPTYSSGGFGFWNERSYVQNYYDDLRVRLALSAEPISYLGTEEVIP